MSGWTNECPECGATLTGDHGDESTGITATCSKGGHYWRVIEKKADVSGTRYKLGPRVQKRGSPAHRDSNPEPRP
jgi:hypothetical protein